MTEQDPAQPSPELDLDHLFAQARILTPTDEGAAGRFLARRALTRSRTQTVRRAGWLSAALATAALVAGVTVLRPAGDLGRALPASAAYDAYQSAWGEGW